MVLVPDRIVEGSPQGARPPIGFISRWMVRVSWFLVLGAFIGWIGYAWGGESLIRRIHQEQVQLPFGKHPILNPDKSVDFYLRLGNAAVTDILLYILLGIGMIHLLRILTIHPDKRPRFCAMFGVFVFAAFYWINPNERIVSIHGFCHTGIVYQILNGPWPPTNPLLAREPLLYPWGVHSMVAFACGALHISPAWAFAIFNLISLALCIGLVGVIARRLSPDPDSRVFAVLAGLFAGTVMPKPLLQSLSESAGFRLDWRPIPAGLKFITINQAPMGIVFFLLLVVSLIQLTRNRHPFWYCLLLFLAVAGCGFSYPLNFPAACASCGLVALVLAVRRGVNRQSITHLARILIPLGFGIAVLIPYLRLITGSNADQKVQLVQPLWILRNCLIIAVVLWPMALLIVLERKGLRDRWNPEVALVLITIIVACLGCYLGMHMFHQAEYKSLSLAGIIVGIFGGMAFARIRTRLHPLVFCLLLIVFMFPMIHYLVPIATSHSWVRTPNYREEGTTLRPTDSQQDQLYRWIREETPSSAVFLDSSLDISVLGRRSLYIGWDGQSNPDSTQNGYNISMNDWLGRQSGYNPDLLDHRNRILRAIYSPDQPLSTSHLAELRRFDPVYIVIRNPMLFSRFTGDDFQTVFTDSSGQVRVVQLRCP